MARAGAWNFISDFTALVKTFCRSEGANPFRQVFSEISRTKMQITLTSADSKHLPSQKQYFVGIQQRCLNKKKTLVHAKSFSESGAWRLLREVASDYKKIVFCSCAFCVFPRYSYINSFSYQLFLCGRIVGTVVLGGLEISHGFQQFHTVAMNATDYHNYFVN